LLVAGRGGPRIITRGATYALHANPMDIDVFQFRALVDETRGEPVSATRAATLRRALGLWRGPPLADVASPADKLCHVLEEARLAAAEEWLDAELGLGRHRAVIDQLVELTAQHPDRQHLVALHMLALYRDGRVSDALRAYRQVRGRLVEEFGLDPYVELQQLESAILRADPCLDLPDPARPWPASHLASGASSLLADYAGTEVPASVGGADRNDRVWDAAGQTPIVTPVGRAHAATAFVTHARRAGRR
jgi:hypothetical protein